MPERSSKKRPRDLNSLAARIVAEATGDAEPAAPSTKNPAAVALGRLGGQKGGKARAESLAAKRRKDIARQAAPSTSGCFAGPLEVLTVYLQRVTIHPNPEKIANVRALLLARVKSAQASGQQSALAQLVAGRHGPEFQVNILFSDLAAFEATRKRDQADAAFQKFAATLASLSREPVAIELFEVLVPMPGTETASPRRAVGARAKRIAK